MISKLEDVLLRCRTGDFRQILFHHLDDGVSLLQLRCASRALYDILDYQRHRLFRRLYIQAPLPEPDEMQLVEFVSQHCQALIINIGYEESSLTRPQNMLGDHLSRRSQEFVQSFVRKLSLDQLTNDSSRLHGHNAIQSLRRSLESMLSGAGIPRVSTPQGRRSSLEQQVFERVESRWIGLLSQFRQMYSLTLRVYGDTGWPGRTDIEDTLVNIRIAIEHADIPALRTIKLMPIHAMGIIHLPWCGLHAFGESLVSAVRAWERIETLDLRIHYPPALTGKHQSMFYNVFYKYLESFAPSLRCLRLVWLGSEGPSPLALHLEASVKETHAIRWKSLEELWLGNITHPHQSIRLIPTLAPNVTLAKTLRSTRRDSVAVDPNDSSAWVEVLLGSRGMLTEKLVDSSSSIYSRDSARLSAPWAGGISRSSREVEIYPDF